MTDEYARIKATGTQYDNLIRSAAESEGVRYDLLHKQIYNESSFKADAKSPTGPLGLPQFTEATGRAYGLMSPEDRLDPLKAVPAMARHMRDLIDKYDGDELTAALAYNQGEGPLGAPQVSAMRAGDFSKLSAEGRGYMAKLSDVAVSPHRDYFSGLLGGPAVIQPGALGLVGKPIEKGMSIADMARQQGKPLSGDDETGAWDGTGKAAKAALETSVVGAAFRGYSEEGANLGTVVSMMRPVSRMQHNPMTDEDFETLDELGVQPEYYRQFASAEREEWKHILPVVLDSQESQKNYDSAGWAAKLTGGLVGLWTGPYQTGHLHPVKLMPLPNA